MGKSLARLTESEIDKVLELSGVRRVSGPNSSHRVWEGYFSPQDFDRKKDISVGIKVFVDEKICEGVLLQESYALRSITINSDGIFIDCPNERQREITKAKPLLYLIKQGYDFNFP